jgi:hypothetical protein
MKNRAHIQIEIYKLFQGQTMSYLEQYSILLGKKDLGGLDASLYVDHVKTIKFFHLGIHVSKQIIIKRVEKKKNKLSI